jgi:hypothetical protein
MDEKTDLRERERGTEGDEGWKDEEGGTKVCRFDGEIEGCSG